MVNGHSYAVVGNPPFGYRAWLALAFMNHAASFADYVGMILPMAFQSDGKGSPKLRVKGLKLVHTRDLPSDSFVDAGGQTVKVNALWQVWQRGVNNARAAPTCKQWLDVFTVDNRKERRCGQARMAHADYFLQRTFYREPPTLVLNIGFDCEFPRTKDGRRTRTSSWDIKIEGVAFEIKTATEYVHGNFQFNHVRYHRDYGALLCVGVAPGLILFDAWSKADIATGKAGHLVSMDKGASATHKLTNRSGRLRPIAEYEEHILALVASMEDSL